MASTRAKSLIEGPIQSNDPALVALYDVVKQAIRRLVSAGIPAEFEVLKRINHELRTPSGIHISIGGPHETRYLFIKFSFPNIDVECHRPKIEHHISGPNFEHNVIKAVAAIEQSIEIVADAVRAERRVDGKPQFVLVTDSLSGSAAVIGTYTVAGGHVLKDVEIATLYQAACGDDEEYLNPFPKPTSEVIFDDVAVQKYGSDWVVTSAQIKALAEQAFGSVSGEDDKLDDGSDWFSINQDWSKFTLKNAAKIALLLNKNKGSTDLPFRRMSNPHPIWR